MGGVRNNNRADAPPTRDQRVHIGQCAWNARDLGSGGDVGLCCRRKLVSRQRFPSADERRRIGVDRRRVHDLVDGGFEVRFEVIGRQGTPCGAIAGLGR